MPFSRLRNRAGLPSLLEPVARVMNHGKRDLNGHGFSRSGIVFLFNPHPSGPKRPEIFFAGFYGPAEQLAEKSLFFFASLALARIFAAAQVGFRVVVCLCGRFLRSAETLLPDQARA